MTVVTSARTDHTTGPISSPTESFLLSPFLASFLEIHVYTKKFFLVVLGYGNQGLCIDLQPQPFLIFYFETESP